MKSIRQSGVVAVAIAILLATSAIFAVVGLSGIAVADHGSSDVEHVLGGQESEGALKITIRDGNVQVERYDGSSFVEQYYSGDDSETVLYIDGTLYDVPGGGLTDAGGTTLTVADQYTTDGGSTVVTEFQPAGSTGVELVQRISYSGTNQYFDLRWEVTNTGSESVENVRLLNGKDTYLSGGDSGHGFWNGDLDTIGVRKTVDGEQQRLSMRGITEPYAHQSTYYSTNQDSLEAGALTNTVDETFHDNGYSLEWRRATLTAGDSWTVRARESFTQASVIVTGPGSERLDGDTVELAFDVENVGESTASVSLSVDGPSGWDLSTPSSVSIDSGDVETVTVTADPPESASAGSYDVTLTASTGDSSDAATGVVEIPGSGGDDEPEPRPRFDLVDRSVDKSTVAVGETATVTAVVENSGERAGEYRAVVTDRTQILAVERVTVDAGQSRTLRIPVQYETPGEHTLYVNYHPPGTDLDVVERPLDGANVSVRGAAVPRSVVAPGESYEVTAVVENTGDRSGVAVVEFAAGSDGANGSSARATRNVTLDPGETTDVSHLATADETGVERTWTVNGVAAGNATHLAADRVETGVIDAYAIPAAVSPDEEYRIFAVVHNADEAERTVSVNLGESEGEVGSLRMVTLGPGETTTITRTGVAPADADGSEIVWWVNGLRTEVPLTEDD